MQKNLTKVKRSMALLLSLVMIIGLVPMYAMAAGFRDTEGHWAEAVIEKWSDYGIVVGDENGFRPNDGVRRGEFALMVDRIMKYQTKAANVFNDLPEGAWFTDASLKLNAAGGMNGVGGGSFDPNGSVTREQAFVILARIFGVTPDATGLNVFTDADMVSTWAREAVGGMAKAGYVQGDNGRLDPAGNLNRAQAVQMFDNLIKAYYDKAGTYTINTDGIVVVNASDVVLSGSKTGSLYVTPGVGKGDFTLRDSEVGELTVMGGGRNSIKLENSKVNKVRVNVDSSTGDLRVHSTGNTKIGGAEVAETTETIIFTGDVDVLEVTNGATVIIEGNVGDVKIVGENVTIIVADGATAGNITVEGNNSSVQVDKGATVDAIVVEGNNAGVDVAGTVKDVTINANSASVGGSGKVDNVKVESGNNTAVTTDGSKVTVSSDAGAVSTGNNETISSGSTGNSKPSTETPSTGTGNNNGYVTGPGGGTQTQTFTFDGTATTYETLDALYTAVKAVSATKHVVIELKTASLGDVFVIDAANFPGTNDVTVKNATGFTDPITNSIFVKRSKVTIDGVNFSAADDNVPTTGHRSAIAVGYIGGASITKVTVQNCTITLSASDASALIGIYYDGNTTSATSSINNQITLTNSNGTYGIYGRTNTLEKNTIISNNGPALMFEWTGAWANTVALGTAGNANSFKSGSSNQAVFLGVDILTDDSNKTNTNFGGGSSNGFAAIEEAGLKTLITTLLSQIHTESSCKWVSLNDYNILGTGVTTKERYSRDANNYIWSQYNGSGWTYCSDAVSGLEAGYYRLIDDQSTITYLYESSGIKMGAEIGTIESVSGDLPGSILNGARTYTLKNADGYSRTTHGEIYPELSDTSDISGLGLTQWGKWDTQYYDPDDFVWTGNSSTLTVTRTYAVKTALELNFWEFLTDEDETVFESGSDAAISSDVLGATGNSKFCYAVVGDDLLTAKDNGTGTTKTTGPFYGVLIKAQGAGFAADGYYTSTSITMPTLTYPINIRALVVHRIEDNSNPHPINKAAGYFYNSGTDNSDSTDITRTIVFNGDDGSFVYLNVTITGEVYIP